MKSRLIYALLNSIVGLIIGFHVYTFSEDKFMLIIAAPIAAFLSSMFLWEKKILNKTSLAFTNALLSHYFTFLFIFFGFNFCYWITGNCMDSDGEPPMNIIISIFAAFVPVIFSMLFYGWITIPLFILNGYIARKSMNTISDIQMKEHT